MANQFISYAQNLEDVMLNRVFSALHDGFYVDIGACDPVHDSVTNAFYQRGWSGINIEPTLSFFQRLQQLRTRDVNLQMIISNESKLVDFYQVDGAGISSVEASASIKADQLGFKKKKIQMRATTLAAIAENYCQNRVVHFLKIDVEGHELQVIEGADWTSFRPYVLIIESVSGDCQTNIEVPSWHKNLIKAGYIFSWFDGLNRFYVRQESKELLKHFDRPINIFDQFKLNENHSWVFLQSRIRKVLAKYLSANVKARLRVVRSYMMGSKLG